MAEFYMTCLECIWKHLRDAEHHMEDAMVEAEREKNNAKVLYFSRIKEQVRDIRKNFGPTFNAPVARGCVTCGQHGHKH